MKYNLTRRQKINIELAEKSKNTYVKEVLNKLLSKSDKSVEKIPFNCECSNPDCTEKVPLTLSEYERYNKKMKQFILAKGHIVNDLEKPILKKEKFTVVKKYSLS